jgi:predicted acylesterase/phospholipase RssA
MKLYKKIAVIAGGGADGAHTVGTLSKLNNDYDLAVTISTGSIMGLLVVLKEWKRLATQYMTPETSDITEKSVFTKKGHIHVSKAIWRTVKSLFLPGIELGQSKNLRKLFDEHITKKDYEEAFAAGKEVRVGCYSMQTERTSFFSSRYEEFEDFKDWMWASANPPIVFSTLFKPRRKGGKNEQWVDGGIGVVNPLYQAVLQAEEGAEIDVFCHRPKPKRVWKKYIKNVPHFAARVAGAIWGSSLNKDIKLGLQAAEMKGCIVKIYWMEKEYFNNSLIFGKSKMQLLFERGQANAFNEKNIEVHDFRK